MVIDDFYGWIPYDEMLRVMDRYPHKVPIKGASGTGCDTMWVGLSSSFEKQLRVVPPLCFSRNFNKILPLFLPSLVGGGRV